MDTERFLEPAEAMGLVRVQKLESAQSMIKPWSAFIRGAVVNEFMPTRCTARDFEALARTLGADEFWAFIKLESGEYLAVDQVPAGLEEDQSSAAVIFPSLHSRLTAWWIGHAWRTVELAESAFDGTLNWRPTVAALCVRALLEEAGCLLQEGRLIGEAWGTTKALPADRREVGAYEQFDALLTQFAFASRGLSVNGELTPATNVQTYIDKLARATKNPDIRTWYTWLSNTAHPAVGARIAYATQPLVHEQSGLIRRRFSRVPTTVKKRSDVDLKVAHVSVSALTRVVSILDYLLECSLAIVDDFCLTSGASLLTSEESWRQLAPTRENRMCECGRGGWRDCAHRWGAPAPEIPGKVAVPDRSGRPL